MASLNWNSTHSNAPAPASLQSNPQVYSAAPAFRNVEYGSYAPYQHMGPDSLSSVQMPSSIGPSRSNQRSTGIVTRRKAAQMAAGQTGHVRDNSNGSISDGQQVTPCAPFLIDMKFTIYTPSNGQTPWATCTDLGLGRTPPMTTPCQTGTSTISRPSCRH